MRREGASWGTPRGRAQVSRSQPRSSDLSEMEHGILGTKRGPGAAFGLFEPVLCSRRVVL